MTQAEQLKCILNYYQKGKMKHIIKKLFSFAGLNVTRAKKGKHNNEWLTEGNYDVIIDIGANIGQFSQGFLERNPELIIHAFEPIPEAFQILQKTLGHYKGVDIYNLALGNKSGDFQFHLSSHLTSSSVLPMASLHKTAFPKSKEQKDINVRMERLDNILESKMVEGKKTLCKIDVQGYEYEVIQGGKKVLAYCDLIICEMSFKELYKKQRLFDDVYRELRDMGFIYIGNLSQIFNSIDGSVLQANAIFKSSLKM